MNLIFVLLYNHSWIIPDATPEVCLENVVSAVALLGEREKMHIHKASNNKCSKIHKVLLNKAVL